jgi:Flp pilus assembly protein TadD
MANVNQMYDAATELKSQGDLEGAVAKLREILEADQDHVLSHAALAVYLQKLGILDEAISHAIKVTELEPNESFSFTQLSVIYQRCGRIPEAEDAMEKARIIQMGGGGNAGGSGTPAG